MQASLLLLSKDSKTVAQVLNACDRGCRAVVVDSADAVVVRLRRVQPDIVLADGDLTGYDLAFVVRIAEALPSAQRILFGTRFDAHQAIDAINEGLLFRVLPKPLVRESISRVLREATCLSALQLAARMRDLVSDESHQAREFGDGNTDPVSEPRLSHASPSAAALSPRERQVLHLLERDEELRQIACKLSISIFTVRNHVQAIYKKVGVGSREELFSDVGSVRVGSRLVHHSDC